MHFSYCFGLFLTELVGSKCQKSIFSKTKDFLKNLAREVLGIDPYFVSPKGLDHAMNPLWKFWPSFMLKNSFSEVKSTSITKKMTFGYPFLRGGPSRISVGIPHVFFMKFTNICTFFKNGKIEIFCFH